VRESGRAVNKSIASKGSLKSSFKNTSARLAFPSKKATFYEETTNRTHFSEQDLQYEKKKY